ncbi:MAG: NAD(P)-dependent oxidoreductase, partial [bacterium]|nr:NAD(P)-dependent oxidoreductase [bacterium]
MKRRCVLVTGSSGKLGSALVRHLAPHHDVVQFDVREQEGPELRGIGPVHVGTAADRDAVAEAFEGIDTVVHCGAIPSNRPPFDELLKGNLIGTVNMLEEAGARKEVEQFVFISTIRVHGVLEEVREEFMPHVLPFDESHPFVTVEYYGGSKLHCEHWCRQYVKRFNKPAVVLRPSYIMPLHLEETFKPRPAPDVPDLLQYVATSDLVEGIAKAMDYHPKEGFDAFLCHAPEQFSTTPTLEYVDRVFPDTPKDREKLSR